MKYLLSELFNGIFDNQNLLIFIDNIVNEFVISDLGYGASGNEFYGRLSSYYQTTRDENDSSIIDELINIDDDELKKFINLLPIREDNESINAFKKNSYIEINESEDNIFVINGIEYRWKRLFVNVKEVEGKATALIYHFEQKPSWYKIVDNSFEEPVCPAPLVEFEKPEPKGEIVTANENKTISEDQFFESNIDLASLDPEQKEAITLPSDENSLVIAGAGSGKTRCLVSRLAYLNLVKGIPLNKIILLTFTNEIALEMKNRADEMLNSIYKKFYPLDSDPKIEAKTIDSFFSKIMHIHWTVMGFQREPLRKIVTSGKNDEKVRAIKEVIRINGFTTIYSQYLYSPLLFERLLKEMENHLSGIRSNLRNISNLVDSYINYQISNNVVYDFASITEIIRRALVDPKNKLKEIIENEYQCILIDEFQDISILQNNTFKPLYDGKISFTFCGDDNQTIYSWRGSDNEIIKSIRNRDDVYTCELTTNYRSDPGIVIASNEVLKHVKGRVAKKAIKPRPGQPTKIHVSTYSDDYSELVEEIKRIIKSTESNERQKNLEILILSRKAFYYDSNNNKISILKSVQNALEAVDLKVEKINQKFDLDNAEYRLFVSIVNVLINYHKAYYIGEIKELLKLEKDSPEITDTEICDNIFGEQKSIEILYNKAFLIRYSKGMSFADLVEKYSQQVFNPEESNSAEYDFDLFESLRTLAIDLRTPSLEELKNNKKIFEKFIKTFVRKNSTVNRSYSSSNCDSENIEHYNIQISTVHSAKGLGADVVFLINMNEGDFPSTRAIDNEYRECMKDINEIENARSELDKLRNSLSNTEIDLAISEMKSAGFDDDEKKTLMSFAEWIESNNLKRGLLRLNPVSIRQFIGAYDQALNQLDERYSAKNWDLIKEINSLSNEIDRLSNEKQSFSNNEPGLDDLITKIDILTKQNDGLINARNALQLRQKRFTSSTENIRKFRAKCVCALGYISDMKKEDKIIELKQEIEKRKEERINEETRLFYVSLTRAKKCLYIMYRKGDPASKFLSLIPTEYIQNEKLLSRSQKEDLGEQINKIAETVRQKNDDVELEDLYVSIKDDSIEEYISDYIDGIYDSHPNLSYLTGSAKTLLEYGLRYAAVIKMINLHSEMPISTCLERSALRLIQEKVGKDADHFVADNQYDLEDSLRFIKNGFKNAVHQPGKKYIKGLFKPFDREDESKKYLKSITIMNYFMSSNNMGISSKEYGWNTVCKNDTEGNNRKLMVAAFEFCEKRNSFIHDDPNHWPEDGLSSLFDYYFTIIDLIL